VPTVHYRRPNQHVGPHGALRVVTEREPWRAPQDGPRRAAVTALGFSGSNAHLVLQEYHRAPAAHRDGPQLFVLSARTREQLAATALRLRDALAAEPDADLACVAYTLQAGREAMAVRSAFVAATGPDAVAALERCAARGVTTVYHAAPDFPEATATLLLDEPSSPVANSIVLSEAAPEYAPPGRALIATSMVHGSVPADVDGPEVRAALARLHGTDTTGWEQIAAYDLPRALPGMPVPHPLRKPVRVGEVYVAGDHRDTSSIQGALVSGRRAATAVLQDLGVTP